MGCASSKPQVKAPGGGGSLSTKAAHIVNTTLTKNTPDVVPEPVRKSVAKAAVPVATKVVDTVEDAIGTGLQQVGGRGTTPADQGVANPAQAGVDKPSGGGGSGAGVGSGENGAETQPKDRHPPRVDTGNLQQVVTDAQGTTPTPTFRSPNFRTPRHNIHSEYEFGRELGRGAYSVAYEATDKASGATVAIKQTAIAKLSPAELKLVENEVTLLNELNHRNIMDVYALYRDEEYVYLVCEYVQGGELLAALDMAGVNDFSEESARNIIKQLCEALSHMHENNIAHRDLKLGNVLLESQDYHGTIKLGDFGFAMKFDGESMKRCLGTPEYIAPEVLRCRKRRTAAPYGPMCDMWSIGVMTYVLVSGNFPWKSRERKPLFKEIKKANYDFEHGWDGVSDAARDFVSKLLVLNPADRMSAAEALAHPWLCTHAAEAAREGVGRSLRNLFHARRKLRAHIFRALAMARLSIGSPAASAGLGDIVVGVDASPSNRTTTSDEGDDSSSSNDDEQKTSPKSGGSGDVEAEVVAAAHAHAQLLQQQEAAAAAAKSQLRIESETKAVEDAQTAAAATAAAVDDHHDQLDATVAQLKETAGAEAAAQAAAAEAAAEEAASKAVEEASRMKQENVAEAEAAAVVRSRLLEQQEAAAAAAQSQRRIESETKAVEDAEAAAAATAAAVDDHHEQLDASVAQLKEQALAEALAAAAEREAAAEEAALREKQESVGEAEAAAVARSRLLEQQEAAAAAAQSQRRIESETKAVEDAEAAAAATAAAVDDHHEQLDASVAQLKEQALAEALATAAEREAAAEEETAAMLAAQKAAAVDAARDAEAAAVARASSLEAEGDVDATAAGGDGDEGESR